MLLSQSLALFAMTRSVIKFVEISPLWQFLSLYLVYDKILTYFGNFLM